MADGWTGVDDAPRRELEELSDRSMPGSLRHHIGAWIARADRGVTGRANSAWPVGDPGRPVSIALDETEAWYRRHGRRPLVTVFDGAEPALSAELDRRGYLTATGADVMIGAVTASGGDEPGGRWLVRVTEQPDAAITALVDDEPRLAELTTTALTQRFVTAWWADTLVGGGIGTLDGDWLGVFAMRTRPGWRRRGVAAAVLGSLADEAVTGGATRWWLQVTPDNDGARALYRRVGFRTAHRYHYRAAP
ncbi:MAG: GNAT family N-acetyltransferase [Desertimonas sp.]